MELQVLLCPELNNQTFNEEVAKLRTLVGKLSKTDQNQWNNHNNINLEFLKYRKDFVQRIEETLCSASATQIHTQ